jgi:hypothetical protein
MTDIPNDLLSLVKDNVIVQWCLVVSVILIIGTNTATKLKGPIGTVARWVQSWGEKRAEREAVERRERRQKLITEAGIHRDLVERELSSLHGKVEEMFTDRDAMERLIRDHLGWDYDRTEQLIRLGINPRDIPAAPPLRVIFPERPGQLMPDGEPESEPDEDESQVSPSSD